MWTGSSLRLLGVSATNSKYQEWRGTCYGHNCILHYSNIFCIRRPDSMAQILFHYSFPCRLNITSDLEKPSLQCLVLENMLASWRLTRHAGSTSSLYTLLPRHPVHSVDSSFSFHMFVSIILLLSHAPSVQKYSTQASASVASRAHGASELKVLPLIELITQAVVSWAMSYMYAPGAGVRFEDIVELNLVGGVKKLYGGWRMFWWSYGKGKKRRW